MLKNARNKNRVRKLVSKAAMLPDKLKNCKEKAERTNGIGKISLKIIMTVLVVTILLMMAISNSVILNEYTLKAASLEKEIQTLSAKEKEIEFALEKKNDLVAFEEYASNNLGMLRSGQSSTVNNSSKGEDVIEAYDGSGSEKGVVATILSAISENFIESWNNLTGAE